MSKELAYQIVCYAVEKLKASDENAVADLGFDPEEIRAMEQMTVGELHHLARMGTHFLDIAVDHRCLQNALAHARNEAENESTQDNLIRNGASAEMLQALYGLTPGEVCRRRRLLGAQTPRGRPQRPRPPTQDRIWRTWCARGDLPEPERYLEVARECQVSAQAVWRLVQEAQAIQDTVGGASASPSAVVSLVTRYDGSEG
ncbi:STY4526/YPO1902 family pathogenicity island replication protein [Aquisalimonas lutea]|uniref:STY4526/YPO1902 family pathogenicity island replication protein n=1 Tax=Aquisalimonas lutea TaxID=1327750 RepID=UPI0025B5B26F|nr:STY4526/YPO1902 family pathogenicity island replication protein [Aquisalimonas lutea]MDN3519107.1 STY4526/YPO1902 family pathogenicity island replication protein [Aquisalimonas lutea]